MKVILVREELEDLDESLKDEDELGNNQCLDCLKEIEECIERINQELKKLDSPYFGKIVFELDLEGKKNIFPVYIT